MFVLLASLVLLYLLDRSFVANSFDDGFESARPPRGQAFKPFELRTAPIKSTTEQRIRVRVSPIH